MNKQTRIGNIYRKSIKRIVDDNTQKKNKNNNACFYFV